MKCLKLLLLYLFGQNQRLNNMGLFKFLFDIFSEDADEIEDDLENIYGYCKKHLSNMSDEEKLDLWYEEEADDDD